MSVRTNIETAQHPLLKLQFYKKKILIYRKMIKFVVNRRTICEKGITS